MFITNFPSLALYAREGKGDDMLAYATFKRNAEKLLRLYGKLHGKFVDHFLCISINNEVNGCFGRNATLVAIKKLFVRNFRRSGFVLYDGFIVLNINVREGVCPTLATQ